MPNGFSVLRKINIRGVTYRLASNSDSIAPTEDGSTAVNAYEVGSLLFHEDILYKVVIAIPAGGAIKINQSTEDHNVEPTTIDELFMEAENELQIASEAIELNKTNIDTVTLNSNNKVKLNNANINSVNFTLSGSSLYITTS